MNFLLIQTSFTGDVIAATAVIEKLHEYYPMARIDMLVRKGNEGLLKDHPILKHTWIWDKKENKLANLLRLTQVLRREKYDTVINLHRFLSTGLITVLSGSKDTRGFNKNPLSFLFKKVFPHHLGDGTTEYERNQLLIADLTDDKPAKPKLYPSPADYLEVGSLKMEAGNIQPLTSSIQLPYFCIAPSSVWFTKQLPAEKWVELIQRMPGDCKIYLLGGKEDYEYAELIKAKAGRENVENLSGKLTLLQSAALMASAKMNYVNDSAPLHLCSAMNAPVTAFFLSTTTQFGFVPVSDQSTIIETKVNLDCRPCGSHGYMQCPKGHFKCALTIEMKDVKIV